MSKFDLFANFLQKEYNIDIKKAGLVPPRPGLKWNPVVHRWVSEESAQPPKRNRPMTLYERMRLGKSVRKTIDWTPTQSFKAPKLTALNTGASLRNLSAKLPKMTSPKFPKALSSFEGKKDTLRNKMIGQSQSQAFNKSAPKTSTFNAKNKSPYLSMPASLRGTSIPEALQRPSDKKKNAYTIPDNSQYPSKKQKDTFFRTFGMKKSTPKLGTRTRFKNLARKLAVMGKK